MEHRDSFITSPDELFLIFYHCSRAATLTWIKAVPGFPTRALQTWIEKRKDPRAPSADRGSLCEASLRAQRWSL